MIAFALALVLGVTGTERIVALGSHKFIISKTAERRQTARSDDPNIGAELSIRRTSPQIAKPTSKSDRAWNAVIRRWQRDGQQLAFGADGRIPSQPGSVDIDVILTAASPEVISAQLNVSTFFGGAHPNSNTRTMLWSVALARPLANDEIFADPDNTRLRRLVQQGIDSGSKGCDIPVIAKAKLTVAADGLTFHFDPYELGGYTCAGDSRLSWKEAAPYLLPHLPFDPARLVPLMR